MFCASSAYTGAFFSVAEKLGISVPEDISLFSHGDPLATHTPGVELTFADPLSYQHAYDATVKLIEMARSGEMACAPTAADCRFHPGRACAPCLGEWFYPRSV